MKEKKGAKNERPSLLDVVALLTDRPAQRLARGQVGTIVEQLDDKTLLVEFSDDQGRATFPSLIPGATYFLLAQGLGQGSTDLKKEFKVEPGQTLDLGDVLWPTKP